MNNVAESKSFQERMIDKMRENIGDLITPEEMRKLVDAGMNTILHASPPQLDSYGRPKERKPSVAEAITKEVIEPLVRVQIDEWIASHQAEIEKIVAEVVKNGVGDAVISALNFRLQNDFMQFGNNLVQRLQR